MTDTERLDYLQKLLGHNSRVILRMSWNGRGFRLHETELPGSTNDVRQAIDNFMEEQPLEKSRMTTIWTVPVKVEADDKVPRKHVEDLITAVFSLINVVSSDTKWLLDGQAKWDYGPLDD